ncbi:hypothetical protein PC116_g6736 [Phytophthora cactorum]|uniref:Uncharacterized protein n=2 Tax=Phytophthora cactorum TaxID=29920 RepID=A0A8T1DZI4_9STRA|nr:hypothetical protein PC112_g9929 [Phytophthora cactorum]KAG2862713.1 hypothetical protein PC113_g6070 [Phytophthora cactorum]KAG2915051.1 hypothetical protein PC114_g7960 [Phytophthora cactorum]KAG2929586.1 hypothetical protein PC115_g6826 [Phytophthora cactorum]KAG2946052.1 hypothetical protein PC117_g7957 [Phytophthora cactorum]
MAALPEGMQLVSALDDAELKVLSPVSGGEATASEHVRRALLLPLEGDDALDVDMDIDVDVFRPSAMLDAQLSDAFGESGELYFGSSFQPDLGDAEADIEQMLLCGSEEALHSHHQHQTAPGQGCQCRNFAIRASRVQAQQERVAAASVATKDQKRVLRHTFGAGKRLQGFGFGEGAVMDQSQQQDIEMADGRSTPAIYTGLTVKQEMLAAEHAAAVAEMAHTLPEPILVIKQEVVAPTPERVLHRSRSLEDQIFSSPLHRSQSLSAVSSPLSSTSFVSLESMMATPLSTTSRSSAHPEMPVMMRSLSPADELEKMTASGSKTSMPKMNMLRGNFQVSPGHDTVPLVKPTAVLPPPYLRGAMDSPEKRRAHSKTFNSFAQSLSFSFSNESSTDRIAKENYLSRRYSPDLRRDLEKKDACAQNNTRKRPHSVLVGAKVFSQAGYSQDDLERREDNVRVCGERVNSKSSVNSSTRVAGTSAIFFRPLRYMFDVETGVQVMTEESTTIFDIMCICEQQLDPRKWSAMNC